MQNVPLRSIAVQTGQILTLTQQPVTPRKTQHVFSFFLSYFQWIIMTICDIKVGAVTPEKLHNFSKNCVRFHDSQKEISLTHQQLWYS